MTTNEVINNYEKSCKDLVDKINNLYFDGEADIDWVSDDIGGAVTISDYFLDIDFMLTALKYNATKKQFFDYYDLVIEKEGKQDVNFKNYILYYKGFNQ